MTAQLLGCTSPPSRNHPGRRMFLADPSMQDPFGDVLRAEAFSQASVFSCKFEQGFMDWLE